MELETTPALLGLPERIGDYRLVHRLATGGMGSVWLASRRGPHGADELVAVKTLHAHLSADPVVVEMFTTEARIAASLCHPNVCRVFEAGEAGGTRYLAMEYLFGEPLSRVLERLASLPADDDAVTRLPVVAATVIAWAADGLHAAHELRGSEGELLGLVHRDVAPDNLFVTYGGAAKLVDFGIARTREHVRVTVEGNLRGKIRYSAPERLREIAPDRRADVWSLGVCLWELLVRRPLFPERGVSRLVNSILEGPLLPPSRARSGLPPSLDDVVMRAVTRPLGGRYQTAAELGGALRAWLERGGREATAEDVSRWLHGLFPERQPPDAASPPSRNSAAMPEAPPLLGESAADRSTTASAPALPSLRAGPLVEPAPAAAPARAGHLVVTITPSPLDTGPHEDVPPSRVERRATHETERVLPAVVDALKGSDAPASASVLGGAQPPDWSPSEDALEAEPPTGRAVALHGELDTASHAAPGSAHAPEVDGGEELDEHRTDLLVGASRTPSSQETDEPRTISQSTPALPLDALAPELPPEVSTGTPHGSAGDTLPPGPSSEKELEEIPPRGPSQTRRRPAERLWVWTLAAIALGLVAGALAHQACEVRRPSVREGSSSGGGGSSPAALEHHSQRPKATQRV